jgi:release factor glutamine methyltransferase
MATISKENWEDVLAESFSKEEIQAMWRWIQEEASVPEDILLRLLNKEPIQYIFGHSWFYKREFLVTPDTLIPRPETEELCSLVLEHLHGRRAVLLDVGTGSGCIAITVAAENHNAYFKAIDISSEALKIASKNASLHNVSNRIEFLQLDFLETDVDGDFDCIVSNPPYIAITEKKDLADNVLHWEPQSALFPMHADVLVFYKRLATLLANQRDGCTLFAEINSALGVETLDVFSQFSQRELLRDWSGNYRFIKIKKEGY